MGKLKDNLGSIFIYASFAIFGAAGMLNWISTQLLYKNITIEDMYKMTTNINGMSIIMLFISGFILQSRKNKKKDKK